MDSFRNYLAGCALPPMENAKNAPLLPPGGHKSHLNHLQVRPETWRRLERMHSLEGGIDSVIVNWMNDNVPEDPLDLCEIDSDERLTIPCPSIVDAFPNVMKKPDNVSRMVPWLELLPLQTVETTLHLLYPHIQDWGFVLIDDPDNWDKDIFQYFSLSAKGSQISRSSLTLAFQPPWILSDQDIKEFAECRTFPPFRRSGNAYPIKLESYHRLWAKMWDVCVRRRTHWFVLTSYNTWVFGAFSEGWSSAFVTGVYTHDSCNPSIAECLAFWAISALRIAGSASVPKVGDGTEYALFETPCVIYDVMGQNMEEVPETLGHILLPVSIPLPRPAIQLEAPTNSVSNWAGKNDDVTSSAGVYSNLSETCSYDSGISGTVAPMNRPEGRSSLRSPMLTKWLATASSDAVLNAQVDIPPIARQLAPMTASAMGDWLV